MEQSSINRRNQSRSSFSTPTSAPSHRPMPPSAPAAGVRAPAIWRGGTRAAGVPPAGLSKPQLCHFSSTLATPTSAPATTQQRLFDANISNNTTPSAPAGAPRMRRPVGVLSARYVTHAAHRPRGARPHLQLGADEAMPLARRCQRVKPQLYHAAVAGRVLIRPLDSEAILHMRVCLCARMSG